MSNELGTPFIPAWLDDLTLKAPEFRVLCHLWRRRDTSGTCFPAVSSIMKMCRLAEGTVWAALKSLEGKGLLTRKRNYRRANTYRLKIPRAITTKETVINDDQSPSKAPWQSPSRLPCQSRQTRRRKGSPIKVPQLRESEAPSRHEWPVSIPEDVAATLAESLAMPVTDLREAYEQFRRNKLAFGDSLPLRDADVWASFQGWLENSKEGRGLRNKAEVNGKSTQQGTPVSPKEPPSWRDALAPDDDDRLCFGKTPWERILPFYQNRIVKKMTKLENQERPPPLR